MALLNFLRSESRESVTATPEVEAFLKGYSIEVMPRTAEKVEHFRELLPAGTSVYIANIDGTLIKEMVATAKRLNTEGYPVMPHFPARSIANMAELQD